MSSPNLIKWRAANGFKTLGQRIRALRQRKDLTQEQLGEVSELNYKYVGEIERGDKTASVETLDRIAKGLEVPLVELLRFDHEAGSKKEVVRMIKELLGEMTEEELRQALKLLKAIHY